MLVGAPGVVAVEVNVSCPNLDDRSRMFAHSAQATAEAVAASRACGLPLWVKLSPNVSDLVDIAAAALDAGAETLVLVNTVLGMAIDVRRRDYRLGSAAGGGGLSGPAISPVAVRAVHDCRGRVPRCRHRGCRRGVARCRRGGDDACRRGRGRGGNGDVPRSARPARVLAGLRRWCRWHDVGDVRALVGAVHRGRGTGPRPGARPLVTQPRSGQPPAGWAPPAGARLDPPPPPPAAPAPPPPAAPPPPPPAPAPPAPTPSPPPAAPAPVAPVRPRPGVARPDVPSRLPPIPPRGGQGTREGDHGR